MKNEELIAILMEFPLDMDVEDCRPVIERRVIKFRAGCDQSYCHLTAAYELKAKRVRSFIKIAKGALTNIGKDSQTPESIKRKLRGLYGYLNDLEEQT